MNSRSNGLLQATKAPKKNTRQRPGGGQPGSVAAQTASLLLAAPPRWSTHGKITGSSDNNEAPVVLGASATRLDTSVKDTVIADGSHLNASHAQENSQPTATKSADEQRLAELEAELAALKNFKKAAIDKAVNGSHKPTPIHSYDETIREEDPKNFVASSTYSGQRVGFIFRHGVQGLGYYKDKLIAEQGKTDSERSSKAGSTQSNSTTETSAKSDNAVPSGSRKRASSRSHSREGRSSRSGRDRHRHRRSSRSASRGRRHRSRSSRSRSRSRGRSRRGRRRRSRSSSRDRRRSSRRHSSRDRSRRKRHHRSRSRDRRRSHDRRRRDRRDSRDSGSSRSSSPASKSTNTTAETSAPSDLFDFNANIIAERIAELENSKCSARRTPSVILQDVSQCLHDDVKVSNLLSGDVVCSRSEFLAAYASLWSPASANDPQSPPKRMELQKRVYMQRRGVQKASQTTTLSLDFKRYITSVKPETDSATPFWQQLGIGAATKTAAQDLVFLFVAIKNQIVLIYVAVDGEGLGADEKLSLQSTKFGESAIFKAAKDIAEKLTDQEMGPLDVHFNDYHSIEEVNFESIMKKMAGGASS